MKIELTDESIRILKIGLCYIGLSLKGETVDNSKMSDYNKGLWYDSLFWIMQALDDPINENSKNKIEMDK